MSSLIITLIQTNLHWEDKRANLDMLRGKIDDIQEKTEVVILPEMFNTGFSMNPELLSESIDGETIMWMKKISAEKKIILCGSLMIKENKKYFNRLIWMLPNGEYGHYDKRHLFAYGEEDLHYSAGDKRLIAAVKGWKINLQICYDLRFPVWSRQGSAGGNYHQKPEYDLLVYVANWPETRKLAWQTLLQARAIENQCYVAGVNRVGKDGNDLYYSGNSMIIDPLGKILYQKEHDEDVFTYTLQKENLTNVRDRFPFWKDADSFNINL